TNHFVLTANPAVAPKVKERLAKFNEMVADKKGPNKFAEEGRTLLSRMPRLDAQRNLRKEYEKLVDGGTDVEKFETARAEILDSTKLKRSEALAFAKKVMEATDVIKENYLKEVSPAEMVTWAIRGLYRRIDEKVPDEVETRLKKVKNLTTAQ